MAFDRDSTLKQGEKFLRQGRLDAAIREYAKVVEAQPRDWNTANLLGDLYFRSGTVDQALAQYHRIAEQLLREAFLPQAAALYKKILKIRPDEDATQLLLADIATRQGLLQEAKAHLTSVAARRKARGDRDGMADIAIRLGSLDPADFTARLEAALTLEEMGQTAEAAARFRALYTDLRATQPADALDALRHAVRLDPQDRDGRTILARETIAAGDVLGARDYLDRETAGSDPALLSALVELDLRSGRVDAARELMTDLLALDPDIRHRLLATAWTLCESEPDAAYACIDTVTDSAIAAGEFGEAAAHLQEFASRRPAHIPTLLKLVDVSVDGGLEASLHLGQLQLADAYLDAGQALEARVIAEDLVAREPWEHTHIERFRRALVLLEIEDPDAVIADRLSGDSSFMHAGFMDLSTDLFGEAGSETASETGGVHVAFEAPGGLVQAESSVVEAPATERVAIDTPAAEPVAVEALVVESPVVESLIAEPVAGDELELELALAEDLPTDDSFVAETVDDVTAPVDAVAEAPEAAAPADTTEEDEVIMSLASFELPVASAAVAAPALEVTVPDDGMASAGAEHDAFESESDALLDELDITGILGGLDQSGGSGSAADLESVFGDLRSEAELDDAEFASQYLKLAGTYIDMGMLDEAMNALRTAAETPSQRFEAASMLGRLHAQRGETAKAIEWLEQAAKEPSPNLVEGRALLYDLGTMLEKHVEYPRALAVFLDLQADAGDYRDVPKRIGRLARVRTGG